MAEEQEFDDSPWGDTDEEYTPQQDEDPIELSDDEVSLGVEAKKRRTLKAKSIERPPSRTSEMIEIDRGGTTSPVQQCFKALQQLKKKVCYEPGASCQSDLARWRLKTRTYRCWRRRRWK